MIVKSVVILNQFYAILNKLLIAPLLQLLSNCLESGKKKKSFMDRMLKKRCRGAQVFLYVFLIEIMRRFNKS